MEMYRGRVSICPRNVFNPMLSVTLDSSRWEDAIAVCFFGVRYYWLLELRKALELTITRVSKIQIMGR